MCILHPLMLAESMMVQQQPYKPFTVLPAVYLFALIVSLSIESEGYCSSSGLFVADIVHNHSNLGISFARAIWIGTCRNSVGTSLDALAIVEITRFDIHNFVVSHSCGAREDLGEVVVVLHQHWEIFLDHGCANFHVEILPDGFGTPVSVEICQIVTRVFVLVCLQSESVPISTLYIFVLEVKSQHVG